MDGGSAAGTSGSGGRSSQDRDGGNAAGGGNAGGGGSNGGASAAGGTTGTGGASNAGGAAGNPGQFRKAVADDFCSLTQKYPCLSYTQGGTSDPTLCSHDLQAIQLQLGGDACVNQWASVMRCLMNTWGCPCDDTDPPPPNPTEPSCFIATWVESNACSTERGLFRDCQNDNRPPDLPTGSSMGTSGECDWGATENGCNVSCDRSSPQRGRLFEADCTGSPDAVQKCTCKLNEATLLEGIPGEQPKDFYADDCADVGQQLADGQCEKMVNCCFTWTPGDAGGGTSPEQCSCVSDPKSEGYDTCDALAKQGGGKVVDLCPRYLRPAGIFPGM
jgi:hypothetical protein